MKRCNECNINIKDNTILCPLCSNSLEELDGVEEYLMYPQLIATPTSYPFVKKLLMFFSVLGSIASVVVNLYVDPDFMWSAIIISAILYAWGAIYNLLRKNTNSGFKILVQVLLASLLAIVIDTQIGHTRWAFSYVIPSILCVGTVCVIILILYNRTDWARYVVYQFLIAIFGFIPLVFYITGIAESLVMCTITSLLSVASLLATIILGDKSIKAEFKRRMHF